MADAEHVKPRGLYVEEAIAAALESRWADAVAVNEALHRPPRRPTRRRTTVSARRGASSASSREALAAYQSSLELNPLNPIAQKQVRRIAALLEARARPRGRRRRHRRRPVQRGARQERADHAEPSPRGHRRRRRGRARRHSGADRLRESAARRDVARRCPGRCRVEAQPSPAPLMETGNRYSAAVARVEDERIELIIREIFQAPENSRKSSFPVVTHGPPRRLPAVRQGFSAVRARRGRRGLRGRRR